MYNIIMLEGKWDRQIKVYFYFKNVLRDIISKTVLEKSAVCADILEIHS